jgi:phosphatidylglycerol:prolipoprotein diacylglycerol transferase
MNKESIMLGYLMHPNINPTILNIAGPPAIRWYSLMYIVGFLAVYFFLTYQIKNERIRFQPKMDKKLDAAGRIKLNMDIMQDIFFLAMLGVLVGGRLGYVLFYNLSYFLQNPAEIIMVWKGGMSFHGGLLFTILFEFLYIRKKKLDFLGIADAFIVPVPLALAAGRWGNFVNGELWGRITTSKIGMLFTGHTFGKEKVPGAALVGINENIPHLNKTGGEVAKELGIIHNGVSVNLPRHASQLYEMFLEGIILFFVLWIIMKLLISMFIGGYGLGRFLVEFVRQPDIQVGVNGFLLGNWLTMGMLLSFPMFLLGAFGVWFFMKKNMRNDVWVS